ncbi:MAG: hypothetical protein ABIR70_10360 [Bryobacteraceae bacterium]
MYYFLILIVPAAGFVASIMRMAAVHTPPVPERPSANLTKPTGYDQHRRPLVGSNA